MIYQDKDRFSIRLARDNKGNEVYREYSNHIDNFFVPEMGSLMQYTGIKDINAKEIYEGDIVNGYIDQDENDYIVKFNNGCFYIEIDKDR